MKAWAQDTVRGWWDGRGGAAGRLARGLLAPLAWAYRAEVARRNRAHDRRGGTRVDGLAVVSLGNLTVGGTGKTPLAGWTVRLLGAHGLRPALVSRGFGEDELLLHRRWNPDAPVVADVDRVAAARRARAEGADVAVLDDGFQTRALARDLDIVLVATEDPWPARLLPSGPYREPEQALGRAAAVVVTRRTARPPEAASRAEAIRARFPHLLVARADLEVGGWQELSGAPAGPPEGPLLAAAAVARPRAFAEQLAATLGRPVELARFPDHHAFTRRDAEGLRARAGDRTLVVTEKDAVKLVRHAAVLGPVRVAAQAVRWVEGEQALADRIVDAARRGE